jgi:hypothetical protein
MGFGITRTVTIGSMVLFISAGCSRPLHYWTILNSDEMFNAEKIVVLGAQTENTNDECILPAIKSTIMAFSQKKWSVVPFEALRHRKTGFLVPIQLPSQRCFPEHGAVWKMCSDMESLDKNYARTLRLEFEASLVCVLWTEKCGTNEKKDMVFFQFYRTIDGTPVARYKVVGPHSDLPETTGDIYNKVIVSKSNYQVESAMASIAHAAVEALQMDLNNHYKR